MSFIKKIIRIVFFIPALILFVLYIFFVDLLIKFVVWIYNRLPEGEIKEAFLRGYLRGVSPPRDKVI